MKKYAIASIPVGLMQIVNAWTLVQAKGAITSLAMVIVTLEVAWAIASLVVAIRVKHQPTRYLASAFIVYTLAAWAISFFIEALDSNSIDSNSIRLWAVYAGGIFGLSYAAASAYVASRP
jgi:hypothetical protein